MLVMIVHPSRKANKHFSQMSRFVLISLLYLFIYFPSFFVRHIEIVMAIKERRRAGGIV